MPQIDRLVSLMARLRSPTGCPWDLEQTHESLKTYLLEEAYEVMEAIDSGSDEDLRDELGDLLLQVVFHAQIASETGRFTLESVAEAICGKLIRRHPHVFGNVSVEGSAEVLRNWETIKADEKRKKGEEATPSSLGGVPGALPALLRARAIQEKAARTGFEWSGLEEISCKIREEMDELLEAAQSSGKESTEEELGDLLFAAAAMGRCLDICPEQALQKATAKFQKRFEAMEAEFQKDGAALTDATIEEMEAAWEKAKVSDEAHDLGDGSLA